MIKTSNILQILYLLFTSIYISAPALFNGYPVMHYDSAHYISQSVSLDDASTNPIGYSLFIRAFSWQFTLWPVVFAQGLILSSLIYMVYKSIFTNKNVIIHHFSAITVLTFLTGMGWVSSNILADIFAPISILSCYLFFTKNTQLNIRIFSIICMTYACTTHFSISMIIFVLMVLMIIFNAFITFQQYRELLSKVAIVIIAVIISNIFINNYYRFTNQKEKTQSISHVLIMARLMETGILDKFLEEHCEDNRYSLCYYKDLFPILPSEFVWTKESPFFKTGGWNYSSEEYNEIIHQIFSNGQYVSLFVYKGLISTIQQLATFQIIIINLMDQKGLHEIINWHFKHEEKKFKISLQYIKNKFDLTLINISYYLLFGLSIITILMYFYRRDLNKNNNLKIFVFIVILGIVINAAITGTFSNVVSRYQARINWLLILVAIIITQKYFFEVLRSFLIKLQKEY